MATSASTPILLSSLTADPVLRAFFKRGERDSGAQPVAPKPAPALQGGAAVALCDA